MELRPAAEAPPETGVGLGAGSGENTGFDGFDAAPFEAIVLLDPMPGNGPAGAGVRDGTFAGPCVGSVGDEMVVAGTPVFAPTTGVTGLTGDDPSVVFDGPGFKGWAGGRVDV
jgi:hypothetical protein